MKERTKTMTAKTVKTAKTAKPCKTEYLSRAAFQILSGCFFVQHGIAVLVNESVNRLYPKESKAKRAKMVEKILTNAANEAIDACGFPGVTAQTVWGGGPEKSAKKGKKK